MGDLIGHLVPGTLFITLSVWWYVNSLITCTGRRARGLQKGSDHSFTSHANVWYSCTCRNRRIPLEPAAKLILATLGALLELFYQSQYTLFTETGEFVQSHLNNYSHATMFSCFAISGFVDLITYYKLLPLPLGTSHLVLSGAFFTEGALFFNHLHGRSELDVRVHTFVYLLAFMTAVMILLETAISTSPLPAILRAYFTTIHGTWFYQVGFTLHGPHPWTNTPPNVEFIIIALAWHMIAVFVGYLTIYAIIYNAYSKMPKRKRSILETESDSENDDLETT